MTYAPNNKKLDLRCRNQKLGNLREVVNGFRNYENLLPMTVGIVTNNV